MPEGKMNYTEVYEVLDPIIKENPNMNFKNLIENYEDIAAKISYGAFIGRKKKLLGNKGYTYKRKTKKKRYKNSNGGVDVEIVQQVPNEIKFTEAEIVKFINKVVPHTMNIEEYKRLFKIIVKTPNAVYTELQRKGLVTLSDAVFYSFRKKVWSLLKEHKSKNNNVANNVDGIPPEYEVSRKGVIYTIEHTDPNAGEEVVTAMKKVFDVLRKKKGFNLEVQELKYGFEIRSFTK